MHNGEKIGLVIPALDEERSIGDVVRAFLALRTPIGSRLIDIVVVADNGSRDNTASIAREAGALVISESRRGYGAACLAAVAALPSDIGIIVFADADRSDDPGELPLLVAALDKGADLVVGSRALGNAEPGALTPQQIFGNRLAAFLIRTIWRHPITDLGPFRAIRRVAYEKLDMADRTYGWTVEMQVKAIQRGLQVTEVPVSYLRRVGVSKISGTIRGTIGAGRKILGMIAILWLRDSSWRTRARARVIALVTIATGALALWGPCPCCILPSGSPAEARSNLSASASAIPNATSLDAWATPPVKGIALLMHAGDSFDYSPMIDEIAATGANAIELAIPYYQANARSSNPGAKRASTPSHATVSAAIRRARAHELQVYLLPVVLLDHAAENEWRGVMKPDDPDAWWRDYERLIKELAALAAREDAQALSVGSELIWSEGMRDRWNPLIESVRKHFRGRLLYSANWDHFRPVTFWDRLDAVGISSYFELTRDSEASQSELHAAWNQEREKILEWQREIGKPLIFTEVGYPAIDGGAVFPWDYTIKGHSDEEEQRRALAAFIEAWRETPELHGAFIYEWGVVGRGSSSYSPRGRLAEAVIRQWMAARSGKERNL